MRGSKEILRQWITDKRYRELISCAHGGWYQDDVILEPLAEHYEPNPLFDELRLLCERGIRFSAEDSLYRGHLYGHCRPGWHEDRSILEMHTYLPLCIYPHEQLCSTGGSMHMEPSANFAAP